MKNFERDLERLDRLTAGRADRGLVAGLEPDAWPGILAALLVPLIAFGVQFLFWSHLRPLAWFLFYPAVFLGSWIGGLRGGLGATLLSIPLVWWYFLPPEQQLAKGLSAFISSSVFLLMGVVFSLFNARLQRANRLAVEALAAAHSASEKIQRSHRAFRDLIEQAPDGVFVADIEGVYTDVNTAGCRMLGFTREEIIGKAIADLIPASDGPRLKQVRGELVSGGTHVATWSLRCKNGSFLPVEISACILADGRWQGFVRDISARRRDEEQLRRAAIVFQSTNEGILVTDGSGRIIAANRAYENMSGFAQAEILGQNPRFQKSGRHDTDFYRKLWASVQTTGQWQGELWNRRKNGEIYPAWENISAVQDSGGAVTNYVAVLSDISRVKEAEERLNHLAHHDALTGLPNRLLLTATLEKSVEHAARHCRKLALLFLDLDRFKLINDTMGHAVGDQLLRLTGERLRQCVRSDDTVARLGGDEFTIILEEIASPDDPAHIARKIIAALVEPAVLDNREIVTSTSIGISIYPDDATDAADLVKAADAALYRAKERGRNTFEFYTADLTARATERLTLEGELRRAIAGNQLQIHYQPQIEVASGRIVGVEALLRWHDPKAGWISPERFIPVAEESGLIDVIGQWVIRGACTQARAWFEAGLCPGHVCINLSGRQILYGQVVELVESALQGSGLRPEQVRIELEITESVLQSMEHSLGVLHKLRALGVKVAIDDFGTGYSSLSVLKQLPIDTLKIDRAFMRGIPGDRDNSAIATAIVSMGHSLGLKVVAEGVEDESQLEFLRKLGCDEAQGFLFSEALPAGEMTALLRPDAGPMCLPAAQRVRLEAS